jgi:hypothetical protein
MNAVVIFLNATGAIVLGAIGWFALEFLGRPLREFFNLRREARRLMLLHWDDRSADDVLIIDDDELQIWRRDMVSTRQNFGELAAKLASFDQGEWFAAKFVQMLGFNLKKASGNLRQLSVWFGAHGEEREKSFKKLDEALRFRIDPTRKFYNPHNS